MARANLKRPLLMLVNDGGNDTAPLTFWPWLFSNMLAVLITVASVAGIFFERIYANETASWAAQGTGQDIVNLALGVPALVISAHLASKGSVKAFLVWLGVLAYSCYSYLMYAFCTSFGPMFPVYLAALATSFYLLLGAVISADARKLQRTFSHKAPTRLAGWFLVGLPCLFLLLEGSQIVRALAAGEIPQSAVEAGLRVDPVQVQDLGLFLPGVFIAGVLLLRRQPLGYLLAAPVLVHMTVLGIAVMSMAAVMASRGLPASTEMFVSVGLSTILSLIMASRFLATAGTRKPCSGNCVGCTGHIEEG